MESKFPTKLDVKSCLKSSNFFLCVSVQIKMQTIIMSTGVPHNIEGQRTVIQQVLDPKRNDFNSIDIEQRMPVIKARKTQGSNRICRVSLRTPFNCSLMGQERFTHREYITKDTKDSKDLLFMSFRLRQKNSSISCRRSQVNVQITKNQTHLNANLVLCKLNSFTFFGRLSFSSGNYRRKRIWLDQDRGYSSNSPVSVKERISLKTDFSACHLDYIFNW